LSPDDDEFGTPTWSRNADDEMLRFLERTLTPTEAAEFVLIYIEPEIKIML
jgi:hypothetical protein